MAHALILATAASAAFLGHDLKDKKLGGATENAAAMHAKAVALGVQCEDMCKEVGAFPQGCQCPGWNGSPASSDGQDGRDCYSKYCVPIAHTDDPCPSDAFRTCVAEHSKVPAMMQISWTARIDAVTDAMKQMRMAQQRLAANVVASGVQCEEMCKMTGSYPNGCQCPGWNGTPASSDEQDGRDCYTKFCQPIAHTDDPCPSDDFVTCVHEHTKVAALLETQASDVLVMRANALQEATEKMRKH